MNHVLCVSFERIANLKKKKKQKTFSRALCDIMRYLLLIPIDFTWKKRWRCISGYLWISMECKKKKIFNKKARIYKIASFCGKIILVTSEREREKRKIVKALLLILVNLISDTRSLPIKVNKLSIDHTTQTMINRDDQKNRRMTFREVRFSRRSSMLQVMFRYPLYCIHSSIYPTGIYIYITEWNESPLMHLSRSSR